jgi:hypothetical protein
VRIRPGIVRVVALTLCLQPVRTDAGCGCEKAPPPEATVRPAFASPGSEVGLFGAWAVAGESYTVTFGSAPGSAVPAIAVARRDFADGVYEPQLVVQVPELPLGPTPITVQRDTATVLTVPASDFTVLQAPIALPEGNTETIATCYRAAVGADGTVYFPLDIPEIGERMMFRGALRGYRLTYDADDIVIYNTQGVLMQLLGPDQAGIFTIEDDQATPVPVAAGGADGRVLSTVGQNVRVDFDPSALVDLTLFQPVAGDFSGFRSGDGTGSPKSKGLEFDASQTLPGGQLARLPRVIGGLYRPGSRITVTMDVRFKDPGSAAAVSIGIFAGGGGTAFLEVKGTGAGQMIASFWTGADGSRGQPVGDSSAAALTTDWHRLRVVFAYDGTDIVATGDVLHIGHDGISPETSVLQIASTFSNAFVAGNPVILGGFGLSTPTGSGNRDDTLVDNFTTLAEAGSARDPGDGGPTTGEGVDQNVRSFRLTYDRHEFVSYRLLHATDPNYFLDPNDHAWHADGSRHIDHDHLVVAIRGVVGDGVPPTPGRTPTFDFRVVTTLADQPADPEGPPRVLSGECQAVVTDPPQGCASAPPPGCQLAVAGTRTSLVLRDRGSDEQDMLSWKWMRGGATEAGAFGDPMARDDGTLCVYDESGSEPRLVIQARAPAAGTCPGARHGRPCWREMGRRGRRSGYLYRDAERTPDGIDTMILRAGAAGRAMIVVKGRGSNLAMPTLPLDAPLRVQLQMENGQCWEATYSATGVRRNSPRSFMARGG